MAQRTVIPGFRKIETSSGGEGGTSNYNDLTNKPFINNVPVVGNLNTVDLKLTDATLTEEGVPADAKVVGTKLEESISALKSDLSDNSNTTGKCFTIKKNIFSNDPQYIEYGKRLTNDGTLYDEDGYYTSAYIPLEQGESYYRSGNIKEDPYHRIALYDSNYKFIDYTQESNLFVNNKNASYLRFCGRTDEIDNTKFGKLLNLRDIKDDIVKNRKKYIDLYTEHYDNYTYVLTTLSMYTAFSGDIFIKSSIICDKKTEVLVQVSENNTDWQNYLKTSNPYVSSDEYQNIIKELKDSIGTTNFYFFRLHIRYADETDISNRDVRIVYEVNEKDKNYHAISIAAHNASEESKNKSDFVCTGEHDEKTINEIILSVLPFGGTVKLSEGDFYIDSINYNPDNVMPTAILFRNQTNNRTMYTLEGVGSPTRINIGELNSTKIHISDTCYDNLDDNTQVSLIRTVNNKVNLTIRGIGFITKANQKPVIYLNGHEANNMNVNDVLIYHENYGDKILANTKSIGVKGVRGSNPGVKYEWKDVFVYGCHEGFRCSGEHLILYSCGARLCTYGYTFAGKPASGTYTHPITLINCCDEINANMPYFGIDLIGKTEVLENTRQAITFIDFNLEWSEEDSPIGGARDYAKEYEPNRFIGSIEYSIESPYGYTDNAKLVPFWTKGHGIGFKSRNQAHFLAGTSAERQSYSNNNAANYMQTYFDTTLNKMVVFDGEIWKDFNGNAVD